MQPIVTKAHYSQPIFQPFLPNQDAYAVYYVSCKLVWAKVLLNILLMCINIILQIPKNIFPLLPDQSCVCVCVCVCAYVHVSLMVALDSWYSFCISQVRLGYTAVTSNSQISVVCNLLHATYPVVSWCLFYLIFKLGPG